MTKNTQEYINGLINKPRLHYLDLSQYSSPSTCDHCNQKTWNQSAPNLEGEIEDLTEFKNLKGFNASNNKFTSLDFLNTLPNKDKLEKINLFGNQIREIDLAQTLSEFPNLKYLNLDFNPLSAKNLNSLTSQQLEKLITGMKDKKIRINSSKGTILADLLDYTQQLINKGGNNTQNAYQLKALIQQSSSPVQPTNQEGNNSPSTPLIIGGIALIGFGLLAGYLWGKRKKEID